jgi:hypothetical protein
VACDRPLCGRLRRRHAARRQPLHGGDGRTRHLVDVESYCKLEGKPLFAAELERELIERL